MHHKNLLASERDTWALTQADVAALLGLSPHTVGNYELCQRLPSVTTAIGMALIFGKTFSQLCPDLTCEVAGRILPRAQRLSIEVEDRSPTTKRRNQEFLAALADRLGAIIPDA